LDFTNREAKLGGSVFIFSLRSSALDPGVLLSRRPERQLGELLQKKEITQPAKDWVIPLGL